MTAGRFLPCRPPNSPPNDTWPPVRRSDLELLAEAGRRLECVAVVLAAGVSGRVEFDNALALSLLRLVDRARCLIGQAGGEP